MRITNLFRCALMAPENEPGGGGGGPPPVPPVTPPAPPEDPPVPPGTITLTTEQLRDRLDRSRTAFLRANGFGSEAELQALRQRDEAATAAAETARLATLTREQQLQEQLAQANEARVASEASAARATFDRHIAGVCAQLGVRNLDYATFAVEQAANALPEGQELDVQAWLSQSMTTNPAMRAALGIEAPVTPVVTGITTVPPVTPPVPPRPGDPPPAVDAFGMTQAAWDARREALGIG